MVQYVSKKISLIKVSGSFTALYFRHHFTLNIDYNGYVALLRKERKSWNQSIFFYTVAIYVEITNRRPQNCYNLGTYIPILSGCQDL